MALDLLEDEISEEPEIELINLDGLINFRRHCLRRRALFRRQVKTYRLHDSERRFQSWISVLAQRFIEMLARQPGLFGDLAHTLRPRHGAERGRNEFRVSGFHRLRQKDFDSLIGVQHFSGIEIKNFSGISINPLGCPPIERQFAWRFGYPCPECSCLPRTKVK